MELQEIKAKDCLQKLQTLRDSRILENDENQQFRQEIADYIDKLEDFILDCRAVGIENERIKKHVEKLAEVTDKLKQLTGSTNSIWITIKHYCKSAYYFLFKSVLSIVGMIFNTSRETQDFQTYFDEEKIKYDRVCELFNFRKNIEDQMRKGQSPRSRLINNILKFQKNELPKILKFEEKLRARMGAQ